MKKFSVNVRVRCMMIWVLCIVLISCKEQIINQAAGTADIPIPVTNVEVKSLSGAAVIFYDIADKATDYVLVEYEVEPGVVREQKASRFLDSLLIDGFPAAGDYSFKLYSVNVVEQRSEPLEMMATILETPLEKAFSTLQVSEDFGGINIKVSNVDESNLIIEVLSEDTVSKKVQTANVHYSSKKKINYSVRGYKDEPREFWLTMRDRWGYRSDTARFELIPLFEEQIPKDYIDIDVTYPNDISGEDIIDAKWFKYGGKDVLFDGVTDVKNKLALLRPVDVAADTSIHFTLKFKEPIFLSRFRVWQRFNDAKSQYGGDGIKVFELWGSNNPDPSGSFDGWTRIARYELERPSGLDESEALTDEDKKALEEGHEFVIPGEFGRVQYIRFKAIRSWTKTRTIQLSEMRFWGNTGI